jgi:hypothetical protein
MNIDNQLFNKLFSSVISLVLARAWRTCGADKIGYT